MSDEPRRDHLGVVEDEEVARSQQCREIRDPLTHEPSRSGNEEEPAGIARLARVAGDQFVR